MKIPEEMLLKYNVSLNHMDDEVGTYRTYLIATDYICNKIFEGVSTWEEYAEEKQYRQIAREEISKGSD